MMSRLMSNPPPPPPTSLLPVLRDGGMSRLFRDGGMSRFFRDGGMSRRAVGCGRYWRVVFVISSVRQR